MCLFLNVSYYEMLLLAKLKNIIGNIKCLRKIYYSFIIILILQHYFRLGERQLWGSLNTPKSLMTGFMNICTHIHQGEFARDEYTP